MYSTIENAGWHITTERCVNDMKKSVLGLFLSLTVMFGSVMMAGCGKETPAAGNNTPVTEGTDTTVVAPVEPEKVVGPAEGSTKTKEGVVIGKVYQYLSEAAKYEGLTNVGFEGLNTDEFIAWLMENAPDFLYGDNKEYFALDRFMVEGQFCSAYEGLKFISGDGMGWTPELHDEKVTNGEWREYSIFSEWEETGKFHYGE